ncbi:MAG: ABC transporter substrate-binding protein, partial [Geminicoccaceae bacterium]
SISMKHTAARGMSQDNPQQRGSMMRLGFQLVAAAGAVALLSASAAAQDKVFRYATTGDILGLDPHVNNNGPTNAMKDNLYGRLVHRLPDLSLEPDLATEWQLGDDGVTWRFALREGVTFHNRNPFNADDVVYSYERQKQDGAEMSFALASVKEVRKVDDHTVELVTQGPDPTLLLNMPHFYIVDQEYMEENNAFEVVPGAGKTNFANTNANGTGPFKLVEWVQDNRLVLEPNEDWWNQANRTDNLDQAIFTPIANDATRVAALLSGEIDLIYPVPLQDIGRLQGDPNLEVLEGPELRTIFLGIDQWREESLDVPGSKNPFLDQRVRAAFAHALDLDAIHRVVMRGASTPTGLMIAPGINGFQEDMNEPYAYDPERSKELLAEAGYPEGFPVTLDCPNDRYVNDEAICTAVVPMLERIGIDITLNAQNQSLHFNKIGQATGNDTAFYMLGWTPGSYDAHNMLQNITTMDGEAQGTWNSGRYSNPRVEELTDLIAVEIDDAKRNELIREAFQIHKDDVGHLPLHQQALAWGVRTDTVESVQQRPFNDVDLRTVVMK